jgi:hypothetical protein
LRNRREERGRLEEEGRADGRARVGSERREEGEVGVGRRGAVGQKRWGWATRAERGRGKRVAGLGREEREGERVWEGAFFFFFKLLFQTFISFKLFQNFSSFKLFSKNFKSV